MFLFYGIDGFGVFAYLSRREAASVGSIFFKRIFFLQASGVSKKVGTIPPSERAFFHCEKNFRA